MLEQLTVNIRAMMQRKRLMGYEKVITDGKDGQVDFRKASPWQK